jgi:hypothetical protein
VSNTKHGKPKRNAAIAHAVLVHGQTVTSIAETERISKARVSQIVTGYGAQVLGVPKEFQRPVSLLRTYVLKHCIGKDGRLTPCPKKEE